MIVNLKLSKNDNEKIKTTKYNNDLKKILLYTMR